ncbi:hypothetical protein CONCODRAFT_13828 [Conidiobolus coronatus NRRL 28638]|uniref:Mos1 transposase HTH domain-containing protein n=1 Tax=Conidiobolus coronatus (strain ATCC 28846 / CBS 209.66 / NRRL 28638) TaxID=796925 RepID=A0A137NQ26_CONC2|nr:hypothetical protein CONCODRAFT_13828 [Conidiobolus coronatus NRRL 28638]|eukprot:KXN64841.1 hypothetical protein CONCODRAFT_13828 [Conidiobolus coronatus NRRL 28638]
MDSENKIINKYLYKLYEQGKNETEAYEEFSKTHSLHSISLKTVSIWFIKFRLGENSLVDKNLSNKSKLTDDFLISLINENPELNMAELAVLAGTTRQAISKRLNQINSGEQRVSYIKKSSMNASKKLTDEYLIKLIKENPGHNMTELANLAGVSQPAVSVRLKKINSSRSHDNKIVLERNARKAQRKTYVKIKDEDLINLINENPELNMSEIATLANVSTICISKRLRKINADSEIVNYHKKTSAQGPRKKFTDEYLIKLINDNPEMNMSELAALANCSATSISNRLSKINANGERVKYNKKIKSRGNYKKFTNEFLINSISENPELNIYELAKLVGASQSTILRRIKYINKDGERAIMSAKDIKNIQKSCQKKF